MCGFSDAGFTLTRVRDANVELIGGGLEGFPDD